MWVEAAARRVQWLVPFVALWVVLAVASGLYAWVLQTEAPTTESRQASDQPSKDEQASALLTLDASDRLEHMHTVSARISWTGTVFLLGLAMLAGCFVSLRAGWRLSSSRERAQLGAAAFVSLVAPLGIYYGVIGAGWSPMNVLDEARVLATTFEDERVITVMNALAYVPVVLLCAAAAACVRRASRDTSLAGLRAASYELELVLATAAVLLVAAAVEVRAVYELFASGAWQLEGIDVKTALSGVGQLGSAAATTLSLVLSGIVAAIYLPAASALRAHARDLATQSEAADPEAWMAENGFAPPPLRKVVHAAAIAAPALIGSGSEAFLTWLSGT